jgi:8-oxo-dGTP diphosphatase
VTRTTLILLVRENPITHVLLGYKKHGFGKGKYTGIGGKVEHGETIQSAAIRELQEESSVVVLPQHLIDVGHLIFYFPARPEWDLTIQVFLAHTWKGTPTESDEIRPEWFKINNLPFQQMWDDASYWYLRILNGEKIKATFTFKADCETVATAHIESL